MAEVKCFSVCFRKGTGPEQKRDQKQQGEGWKGKKDVKEREREVKYVMQLQVSQAKTFKMSWR